VSVGDWIGGIVVLLVLLGLALTFLPWLAVPACLAFVIAGFAAQDPHGFTTASWVYFGLAAVCALATNGWWQLVSRWKG